MPKDPDKRARRNTVELTEIGSHERATKVPKLPEPEGGFDERTRRWYEVWASCPIASRFTPTDWQRLHMLAYAVDDYWEDPAPRRLAEIRLNEERLGATLLDRLRLQIRIVVPVSERDQKGAKKTAARRSRRKDPRLRLVK